MDVTVENTSAVRRRIRLVVPGADVQKAWTQVVAKIGGKARIKGFRPGKAPRKLIERRYGPMIREEVLDKLLSRTIPSALAESKVDAMSQPELDEVGELREGEDLAVVFSVEVLPELTLDNWQGTSLEVPGCEADDEDLDAELQQIADKFADEIDVEGAAQEGDQVALSYIPAGDEMPTVRRFVVGGEGQPEWVAAALTDAKVETDFSVDEYTHGGEDDERPQPAQITGSVDMVRRRVVPAFDDALAKLDGRFETWDELKDNLRTELTRRAARRAEAWRRDAALDHVVSHNPFDVPRTLVDREVDHTIARTFGPQAMQKGSRLAGLLDQLRESMAGEATVNVRRALVIHHIIADAKIEATDDEVEARTVQMQEEYTDLPEKVRVQMRSDEGKQQTRDGLIQEKCLDWMLDQLTIVPGETLHLRDQAPTGHKHHHTGDDHDDHDGHDHHDHAGHDHDHAGHDHDHAGHDHDGHDHDDAGHDHDHDHDHDATAEDDDGAAT